MKKIITASLVAMMAVTTAHAYIASTDYVDSRTGDVANSTFVKTLGAGKQNLSGAVDALATSVSNTTTNAATKTELQDAQNTLQANIDKKVDQTVYDAHLTTQSGVDSGQNADIEALQKSIAAGGATDAAIKAAAAAAAAAQQTANGAVDVNTQQGEAITALQQDKVDKTTYNTFVQGQATKDSGQDSKITALENNSATKAQIDALNGATATQGTAGGSYIVNVAQEKGVVKPSYANFDTVVNETTGASTSKNAPTTGAVKTYVDTQFGAVNNANTEIAGKVGALETAVTAKGALIDQFADHKDDFVDYKTANDAALAAEAKTRGDADTALGNRVGALEEFNDGLETAATVSATANNVVTSVTTTNGKVTAVGSAKITNAMVADTAAIEKGKLAKGVQDSLDLADSAMQVSALKTLASWGTQNCESTDVTCSLVSKGGAIAWEAVKY